MLDELTISSVISAVVQVVKTAGFPSKWCGVLSIALGIIVSIGYNHSFGFNPILTGVMYGLAASGVYEGVIRAVPVTTKFVGKMVK